MEVCTPAPNNAASVHSGGHMAYTTRRIYPARFSSFRTQIVGVTSRIAILILSVMLLATGPAPGLTAAPDAVLGWIAIMNSTVIAGGTSPLVSTRNVALVSASVFDAVNGIDPRFQALHVQPSAPHHASQSAAAIQAAYVILADLYPKQIGSLTTQRDASIAALASKEKAESINAGVAWGQTVADAILICGFT